MADLYPAASFLLPAGLHCRWMAVSTLISLTFRSKRMARVVRRMVKKLNHSNPLRTPDGVAFPLPSGFSAFETIRCAPEDGKFSV
jgi:hypothetical protein